MGKTSSFFCSSSPGVPSSKCGCRYFQTHLEVGGGARGLCCVRMCAPCQGRPAGGQWGMGGGGTAQARTARHPNSPIITRSCKTVSSLQQAGLNADASMTSGLGRVNGMQFSNQLTPGCKHRVEGRRRACRGVRSALIAGGHTPPLALASRWSFPSSSDSSEGAAASGTEASTEPRRPPGRGTRAFPVRHLRTNADYSRKSCGLWLIGI